ncbi:MAG: CPBP family intramembrane glutamic endopeptidase [Brumimicrobium sp.]
MKERLKQLSPFAQVIVLILIGAVSFIVISILSTLIVQALYPSMPGDDLSLLYKNYPVQFMFMYYLPFQAGFLLTPGLLYFSLTKSGKSIHFKQEKSTWFIWAFLLFAAVFFTLPFFSFLNEEITKYLGVFEELWNLKQLSDNQLIILFGENASFSAFLSAIVFVGILTGIAEEFAFRRFLFRHMLVTTNKFWLSVIGSAFIFALLHFNYIQFIPLLVFGIALALMYHATGSILPGIIVHTLNNVLNVYWLRNDNFPYWMESMEPLLVTPFAFILILLVWYRYFKKVII